jgi:hypothetical protein
MPDKYLKLNCRPVRQAISLILSEAWGEEIEIPDVKVSDNRLIKVRGENFLYHDRHLHFVHADDHAYALYKFLKSVEQVAHVTKPRG